MSHQYDDSPEIVSDHRESIEQNPIAELLIPGSKVRILVALIDAQGQDLNPSEICNRAGIGRDTWYDHKHALLEYGVIEHTRDAGNSPLYAACMDDPIVEWFEKIYSEAGKRKRERLNLESTND